MFSQKEFEKNKQLLFGFLFGINIETYLHHIKYNNNKLTITVPLDNTNNSSNTMQIFKYTKSKFIEAGTYGSTYIYESIDRHPKNYPILCIKIESISDEEDPEKDIDNADLIKYDMLPKEQDISVILKKCQTKHGCIPVTYIGKDVRNNCYIYIMPYMNQPDLTSYLKYNSITAQDVFRILNFIRHQVYEIYKIDTTTLNSDVFYPTNKLLYMDLKPSNVLTHIEKTSNKRITILGDIGSIFPTREKHYFMGNELAELGEKYKNNKEEYNRFIGKEGVREDSYGIYVYHNYSVCTYPPPETLYTHDSYINDIKEGFLNMHTYNYDFQKALSWSLGCLGLSLLMKYSWENKKNIEYKFRYSTYSDLRSHHKEEYKVMIEINKNILETQSYLKKIFGENNSISQCLNYNPNDRPNIDKPFTYDSSIPEINKETFGNWDKNADDELYIEDLCA